EENVTEECGEEDTRPFHSDHVRGRTNSKCSECEEVLREIGCGECEEEEYMAGRKHNRFAFTQGEGAVHRERAGCCERDECKRLAKKEQYFANDRGIHAEHEHANECNPW